MDQCTLIHHFWNFWGLWFKSLLWKDMGSDVSKYFPNQTLYFVILLVLPQEKRNIVWLNELCEERIAHTNETVFYFKCNFWKFALFYSLRLVILISLKFIRKEDLNQYSHSSFRIYIKSYAIFLFFFLLAWASWKQYPPIGPDWSNTFNHNLLSYS